MENKLIIEEEFSDIKIIENTEKKLSEIYLRLAFLENDIKYTRKKNNDDLISIKTTISSYQYIMNLREINEREKDNQIRIFIYSLIFFIIFKKIFFFVFSYVSSFINKLI